MQLERDFTALHLLFQKELVVLIQASVLFFDRGIKGSYIRQPSSDDHFFLFPRNHLRSSLDHSPVMTLHFEPVHQDNAVPQLEQRGTAAKSCPDLESATLLESIDIGEHHHLPAMCCLLYTFVD